MYLTNKFNGLRNDGAFLSKLLAIGLPHEIAHGSLRLTLGRDTTLEDVDFAVDSLKATLQNLRMMSPLYEDFQQGKVESVIERFKADGFPYAN